ncbi:alanine racemase [Candidatus Nomurabacteria bacterium RIFCSPHIGHO2_02_FULL_33_12]|uniref:Alanine racemase n=1 Tax=Candidatus Nomurabacteria bacterium RIFCSPLOWO2_01_FULL_33_17 TaxID=1801764 RepID=A0A1F6WMV4_9BACT|nr:MAG: alanine racemase [Candidatus Nomurabacteria bacterium RIFCSPHIGHO2_02_FULL_33_12]OGI83146.1 MAG: alanine racemase [Candidatus Nomurabacteria bacterium RIFCSPLOWO2_01_FULL_33_17]
MQHRTWVEISTTAIKENITNYRKVLPKGVKIMAVVKANAYGHGRDICAGTAIKSGVDYLAVFTMEDAVILRKNNKSIPILVLKQIDVQDIKIAQNLNIDITISSLPVLKEVIKFNNKNISKKNLNIHLKIDSGLSRQGFLLDEVKNVVGLLNKNIKIKGLYTHFTGAESKKFNSYTQSQVQEFLIWAKAFEDIGYLPILHTSATSGPLLLNVLAFDMVRLGIGMYGLWPSSEIKNIMEKKLTLKPALSWKTVVSEVKTILPDTGVAYEASFITNKKTKIAVLPIGYWDGLPRSATNNIDVLIRGHRCRLLGRVMMNMCIVDVNNVPNVIPGDEVVIIGHQGKETISADEMAICAGTINYEIVTRINPEIPRIAIK